jgi:Fur family ferric uptake transcriptional regulator
MAEPDGHHHHHMVCRDCGEVVPFEDEELEACIARLGQRSVFTVDEHDIVLRGHCGDCEG